MRYLAFGLVVAWLATAEQNPPAGGSVLLSEIKARMAENLSRLPNYTCAQTTERSRQHGLNRVFQPVDKVRLEVALVDGKELYGWPDSNRIFEPDLGHLVAGAGAISNGNFALFAKSVFLSSATSFVFRGETVRDGVPALRFDYAVAAKASLYHLKVDSNDAVVGYHGSFWANRDNFDLIRLEIDADNIPEELGLQSATQRMEYSRVKIGNSDFLLPRSAELTTRGLAGVANRNLTSFHECHQYSGESVLSFTAEPEAAPAPVKAAPEELPLPGDFEVEIALLTPITNGSAVGDQVKARLLHAVRDHRRALLDKGTLLTGHLTQLHRDDGWYHIGIAFTDLESETGHGDLSTRWNTLFVSGGLRETAFHPLQRSFRHGGPSRDGEIVIAGEHPLQLKRGYRITLRSRAKAELSN